MASGVGQVSKINRKKERRSIERATVSTAVAQFDKRCLRSEPQRMRFSEVAVYKALASGQKKRGSERSSEEDAQVFWAQARPSDHFANVAPPL